MKKILGITALVIATSVSGCGWLFGDKGVFHDRGDDYRQASLDKPLEVLVGLNHDAIEDQLVVPRARGEIALEGEFEVPRPEPVNPSAEAEQVKLQLVSRTGSWFRRRLASVAACAPISHD